MLNIIVYGLLTTALSSAAIRLLDTTDVDDEHFNATEPDEFIKKPIVFIINMNSSALFEVGKAYNFVSFIYGDPPLKVQWNFKHCSNNLSCEESQTQMIRSSEISDTLKTGNNRFSTSIDLVIDGTGTLTCNVSNMFGNSIEKYTIIVTDVQIRPNVAELTLKSGDNRILLCKGSMPVQWYFNQYSRIIPVRNTSSMEIFSVNSKSYSHLSRLSLKKVSYLDIGHYYCGPFVTDLELVQRNFKKIYIFVRDETRLIAIPEDLNTWYVNDFGLSVIPCKPTSPDVNVTLYVNGTVYKLPKDYNNWFDVNQGYPVDLYGSIYNESNVFICQANRNNITESRTLTGVINPERLHISIRSEYLNHIIITQNVSLICSINIMSILFHTDWYPSFILQWNVDSQKHQTDRLQVDKKQYYQKAGHIMLHIHNVTREDEGEYVCEQTFITSGEKYYTTYSLKTHLPNEAYMQLIVLGNASKTIQFTQFEIVEWEIQVSAYPQPSLEWRDPKGEKIEMNSEKAFVKNYDTSSKLIIKDIQMSDSGIYRLFADNGVYKKNITVTLLVEDVSNDLEVKGPPIIVAGDNITIKCCASKKMFQNNIRWIHRSTSNEETSISTNENITITKNETELLHRSYLTIEKINNTFDGIIKCNVSHIIRESNETLSEIAELPIRIEDPSNPVVYNSSGLINFEMTDESIQLYCYVGGMPPPTISWFKDGQQLNFDKNHFRALLEDNSQKLIIYFPEYEDNGEYVCNATNRINYAIATIILNFTDKSNGNSWIFLYFITIPLFASCILVYVVCLKREWKLAVSRMLYFKNSGAIDKWNSDLGIQRLSHLLPYDNKWEFPRDKLKLGKQLGSGAFGVIIKAQAFGIIYRNISTTVAVKMIKPNVDPRYIKALDSELKIMIYIGIHLNVVNLLGACTKNKNESMMVIVEYCCFGNIQRYLLKQRERFVNQVTLNGDLDYSTQSTSKNTRNENVAYKTTTSELYDDSGTQITSDCCMVPTEDECSNYDVDYERVPVMPPCTYDLISWSYQIARGMEYLASKKVLHGDLAMRNILLTEKNVVKISDFGLAKSMYNSEYYKKKSDKDLLPVKWMAIESLRDQVFSTQSDIWSFGIVLWEMFSLSVTPYPNVFTFYDLYNRLIEGYRMEIPKYANSEIYSIMLNCWDQEPTKRPSFTDLAKRLGGYLQSDTKSFYDDLNEAFAITNTRRSPAQPSEINCPTTSESITNIVSNNCEKSENGDDLELKSIFHSSR